MAYIHTYNKVWEDEKCKYLLEEGKFMRALTIWLMYAYDSTVDFLIFLSVFLES